MPEVLSEAISELYWTMCNKPAQDPVVAESAQPPHTQSI